MTLIESESVSHSSFHLVSSELLCIPLLSTLNTEVSQLSGGTVILMRSRVITRGARHGVGHNFPQLASKMRQLCLLGLSRARPEHDVKGTLVRRMIRTIRALGRTERT